MSYENTALLLPGNGADGGTSFPDFSRHIRTPTAVGSGIETDTAQSKFYGSSIHRPGGTYAGFRGLQYTIAGGLSADKFTVRCWARTASTANYSFLLDTRGAGNTDPETLAIVFEPSTALLVVIHNPAGSTVNTKSTATISINTWHHVELGRDSGTFYLFLDGNLENTAANTRDLSSTFIGVGDWNASTSNARATHWINDFEIIVGECLHTANFTPPAKQIAPVSGTVLDDAGAAAERRIWVIPRAPQSRAFGGLSDAGDGTYSIDAPDVECTVIALDDDAGTVYNDLADRADVSA